MSWFWSIAETVSQPEQHLKESDRLEPPAGCIWAALFKLPAGMDWLVETAILAVDQWCCTVMPPPLAYIFFWRPLQQRYGLHLAVPGFLDHSCYDIARGHQSRALLELITTTMIYSTSRSFHTKS